MAELAGTCGGYDLQQVAEILELIKGANKGYLSISDGCREACFLFTQGGLRAAWRGVDLPPLGDWLAIQGGIQPEEVGRIGKTRLQRHGNDEREILLEAGISEARIDKAARSLMGRLILDALFWDDPHADANVGDAPFGDGMWGEGVTTVRSGSGVKPLIEGLRSRLRSVKDTMESLPTASVSVLTTSEGKARERLEAAGDSPEGQLLKHVLAKPGIHGAELLEVLNCGEMALVSILAGLTHLELVKATPLPRDAGARRSDAEAQLNRSLAELPSRLWLAQTALGQGDRPGAARHFARAGWLLADEGRHREALERFGEALGQSPGDLEALRGRVHVLWELERVEEAAEDTRELARELIDAGLPTHARKTLEQAIAVRDKIPLERLLVEALILTGDRRESHELGSSLLIKLQNKGHNDDARRLKQLLGEGSSASHQTIASSRPARATGTLRTAVLASTIACLVLLGAAWYSWNELSERKAYATARENARVWLEGDVNLDRLDSLFPERNVGSTAAGQATEKVRSELALLRKDEQAADDLKSYLRIAWDQDIEQAIRILDGTEAQTRALRQPLRQLREEAEAYLEEARQIQRRLQPLIADRRLDRAFMLGRRLLNDFPNVPGIVKDYKKSRVPIQIESTPSGALVRWKGHQVGATPMIVEIALEGTEQLVLERQGYEAVESEISFSELEGPRLAIKLREKSR